MKSLQILLIEDDMIEVMKLTRTIKSLDLDHRVRTANNGEEALCKLEPGEPLPDIILLDLNMPKVNGIEFLSQLKKDERLMHIPTIILTTSKNHNDLVECYKLGVGGYVLKPLKYEDYMSRIEILLAYWSINELKNN